MDHPTSKEKMKKNVWSKEDYYHLAHEASLDTSHPGMKILLKLAANAKNILDLGCGDGTRLNLITKDSNNVFGVDLSLTAIKLAKQKFPKAHFLQADLEQIHLKDKSFDLIYSAYVLEHLANPEKVLKEALNLLESGGRIVLIAPNFGSPNRASPPFRGSRAKKLISGFWQDLIAINQAAKLNWQKVEPIATEDKYQVDWDTTIEPYLGSLIQYLKGQDLTIKQALSCWSQELPNAKIHQRLFKFLGNLGFYPFWMWGPHLVLVAQK